VKKLRLSDLSASDGHILKGIIPGDYICKGGMGIKKSGDRSHDVGCTCDNCDGKGRHVHKDDSEVFIILQGKAKMEIDGKSIPLIAGDVFVAEPGEDHHLVADDQDPCINLYLHAGPERHPKNQVVG